MKRSIILIAVAMTILIGCATRYIWRSDPDERSVSNEFFDAKIIPVFVSGGYKGFAIEIKNKTKKNIEVNWNKTLFISNGQTSGGFMFPGGVWAERNDPKLPDIVFPNVAFGKGLMPNDLVAFDSGTSGTSGIVIKGRYHPGVGGTTGMGWWHQSMSSGIYGVYLTMIVDGNEINETLTVNLSYTDLRQ